MKNNSVLELLSNESLVIFKKELGNVLERVPIKFYFNYSLLDGIFTFIIKYSGAEFNPLLISSYNGTSRFKNSGNGLSIVEQLYSIGLISCAEYSHTDETLNSVKITCKLYYKNTEYARELSKTDIVSNCSAGLFGWLSRSSFSDEILSMCIDDIGFAEFKMFLSEYMHNATLYSEEAKPLLIPFFSFNLTANNKEEFITNIHKGKYICNTTKELSLIVEEWFKELGIKGYIINVTN